MPTTMISEMATVPAVAAWLQNYELVGAFLNWLDQVGAGATALLPIYRRIEAHVLAAIHEVLSDVPPSFYVASQQDGFDWLELHA